jgi:hyperosmotically inducible periplasmic protein
MKSIIVFFSAMLIALPAAAQPKDEKPAMKEGQGQKNAAAAKKGAKSAGLTGKVKSALAADVGLKTLKIDVDSDSSTGVVTLKGRVDSDDTKRRAEKIAKEVSGVKQVKNQLTVGEKTSAKSSKKSS